MPGFKTFALAGVGLMGKAIANELLNLKDKGHINELILLSRSSNPDADVQAFITRGAKLATVSYDDSSSLIAALRGIDVVISTIVHTAIKNEFPLVQAAKDAGVQLVVPSEYGFKTGNDSDTSIFADKTAIQRKLKELDLPYTLFWTGAFPETLLGPDYGADLLSGNITIVGTGDWPITFTSFEDVARFLTHVLVHWPREKLEWQTLRIEGQRASFNEIIAAYETKTGKTVTVTRIPRETIEAKAAADPDDFVLALSLRLSSEHALIGPPELISSREWAEFKPKTVLETLLPA